MKLFLLSITMLFAASLFSANRDFVKLKKLTVEIPDGWKLRQEASSGGIQILGFEKETAYVTLYSSTGNSPDLKNTFTSGGSITQNNINEEYGLLHWNLIQSKKNSLYSQKTYYVRAFSTQYQGDAYYGYVTDSSESNLPSYTALFLTHINPPLRSLTGENYFGKKYYLGWGAANSSDPSMMHNEVKYDVKHTHDIFTKETGGSYAGAQLLGYQVATAKGVRNEWKKIQDNIKDTDMYTQYSSGHGSKDGLGVGLSYREIRDNALFYPAKEIIIFLMACYSGGLVDSFNARKSDWESFGQNGRTLFVMASSKISQASSTGPGTDPSEPNSPKGSAGSAFGFSLWKALAGEADSSLNGTKDGFLTLGEIIEYTSWKTKKVGGHTPVYTGSFNPNLILNRVPSRAFLLSLTGGTSSLTDAQIQQRIQELDRDMRVE